MLIPPRDEEALFAALLTMYNNPEMARETARRGVERAKQFDIEMALGQLSQLLHTL
jgi:hypothetical protein